MDPVKYKKAVKVAMFYMFVQNALICYPVYWIQKWFGCSFSPDEVDGIGKVIWDIARIIVMQEVLFYYSHRYKNTSTKINDLEKNNFFT